MGTIVQIKRTANVTAPTTSDIIEGQLAYSEDKSNNGAGAKLYIGSVNAGGTSVIDTIGGKYYTAAVDAATNNNTASTIVKRDASGNFSAGTVTATLAGSATSANVASYANVLTTPRTIALGGDLSGSATFNGSADITITATIAADSVALGTDTTGNYVANVIPGTGLTGSGFGTEGATPTIALATSGVTANTYGGASSLPVFTVDSYGRITSASNLSLASYLTASSIATLTNKTYDVSTGANNKFSIQGNDISSYSGSGAVVVLDTLPTINGINIGNSADITIDGGSGSYFWAGQSGVVQVGDNKGGIYRSTSSGEGALFTFGAAGAGTMSVGVEGSMFVGTALPSNSGGLNTDYSGWLVVQAGGKFGGDINTLGALKFDHVDNGYVQFYDGTIQRTAYTPNVLTTANVAEVTNLYFTNARARGALTSGNAIAYNSTTGNITLLPSGVTATTYGGSTNIPVITVDAYGRITTAANSSITVASTAFTTVSVSGQSDVVADQATDTLTLAAGTGISITTDASSDTVTFTNSGVTTLAGTTNQITASASTGGVTLSLPTTLVAPGDLTVTGNLYVEGTAITLDTATIVLEDALIKFGNANPADTLDIGFYGQYNSSGTKYAGLYRDHTDGKFRLFSGLASDPTTNSISSGSVTVASLVANLTGGTVSGLTSAIAATDGGTGQNTWTTGDILYASGTNTLAKLAAGTTGYVLQMSGGIPTWGTIDGGTY